MSDYFIVFYRSSREAYSPVGRDETVIVLGAEPKELMSRLRSYALQGDVVIKAITKL